MISSLPRELLAKLPPFLVYWAVSLLACLVFLPFLSWVVFSGDDSHLMRVALDYGGLQPYLQPEVYRELSVANYTPIPMTIYRWVSLLFPMRPLFFLAFMVACMSLVIALAATLASRLTHNVEAQSDGHNTQAGWLTILLMTSLLSLPTLLSRFYTMHYLIGGIFALLALLVLIRKPASEKSDYLSWLAVCGLLFLALLSKEVYLMLLPVILLLAWQRKQWVLAGGALMVTLIYWLWRGHMLGMQLDVGGEGSYFAGFWNIGAGAWLEFIGFYLSSRWLILLALLIAFISDARLSLKLVALALLFGLPGLAVTHGIAEYQLHSDRIFFAMDVALGIVAAVVICRDHRARNLFKLEYAAAAFVFVFFIQVLAVRDYRQEVVTQTDYKITRYLLDRFAAVADQTALVPMNYIQGDLMRVSERLGLNWVSLTQNCLDAQQVPGDQLLIFNDAGELMSRDELQAQCQLASGLTVNAEIAPQYDSGLLSWQLSAAPDVQTGVLFVDRAFAVPLPAFNSQLVKPAPDERYQLFARQGNQWWFSEPRLIEIR
ncbi:hypothetical protein QGM61_11305 [Pseudohongiella sp. SYSU M77423]|uniref:hypothetical protein n=1 Tax=Pseudohongiella sp. SYSU M77423 TaxID=3042312 RepID=UPI00247FC663|nr:hypothetical protein [Pseudohongiella sp. SYSU M77423]MDH7944409.1 hypothetical protein [Pseudohongiella sp. SYSU M77423]